MLIAFGRGSISELNRVPHRDGPLDDMEAKKHHRPTMEQRFEWRNLLK